MWTNYDIYLSNHDTPKSNMFGWIRNKTKLLSTIGDVVEKRRGGKWELERPRSEIMTNNNYHRLGFPHNLSYIIHNFFFFLFLWKLSSSILNYTIFSIYRYYKLLFFLHIYILQVPSKSLWFLFIIALIDYIELIALCYLQNVKFYNLSPQLFDLTI